MSLNKAKKIKSVMVVGYGSMGEGIVKSFATSGFKTYVLTRNPSRIETTPEAVTVCVEPPDETPDLIIESIPEQLQLKVELLERIENKYGKEPILASNTSSLPLDKLGGSLQYPERFIGIHYMHPADTLPMVEVIRIPQTNEDTLDLVRLALKQTGKDALILKKPIIGFLINRLQHALLHEAYFLIEEGVVTASDIDNFAKQMFGPRMCVTGLIEQKDISGLDTHALSQKGIIPHLNLSKKPATIVQELHQMGHLGIKTGQGFYNWELCDSESFKSKTEIKLQKLLDFLQKEVNG